MQIGMRRCEISQKVESTYIEQLVELLTRSVMPDGMRTPLVALVDAVVDPQDFGPASQIAFVHHRHPVDRGTTLLQKIRKVACDLKCINRSQLGCRGWSTALFSCSLS